MDDIREYDWDLNNRLIELRIAAQGELIVRSNLWSLVIALNVVATGMDGGSELDRDELMVGARQLLSDLGYPLVDEA